MFHSVKMSRGVNVSITNVDPSKQVSALLRTSFYEHTQCPIKVGGRVQVFRDLDHSKS